MIRTGKNLETVFKAMYGHRWVHEAAQSIGCTEKTIRRWTAGQTRPASRYIGRIRRALEHKAAELNELSGSF